MGGGSHPWGLLQLWQHPSRVNTCGLAKGESEGPRVSIIPTASPLVLRVLLCVPHFLCKVGGKAKGPGGQGGAGRGAGWGEGEWISDQACVSSSPQAEWPVPGTRAGSPGSSLWDFYT